jgi:hypothetical protein
MDSSDKEMVVSAADKHTKILSCLLDMYASRFEAAVGRLEVGAAQEQAEAEVAGLLHVVCLLLRQ